MKVWDESGNGWEVPYNAELLSINVQGEVICNPLKTPDNSAWTSPERYGFEAIHDVHGCVNYRLDLPNGDYLVITNEDGSTLPEESDLPNITLFLFNDEEGQRAEVEYAELPNNGVDVSLITDEIIFKAAKETDLDAACLIIQDAIRQGDGGVAGMFFSDMQNTADWACFTIGQRYDNLVKYVELEKLYATKD